MKKKLLNFGRIDKITDKYFGELEINFDKTEQVYYLEKDIKLNDSADPIYFIIATKDKKVSKEQIELFELIKLNFPTITDAAYDFAHMHLNEQKEKLKTKYKIESVLILDNKSSAANWELDLINTRDGFSHCIIEFEDLNPKHLSIEG